MRPLKVLYICTYHGARARIAELFTKQLNPLGLEAYSSSFEPGKIGRLPIAVMKEIGLDLPTEPLRSVYDRFRAAEPFDYVVTLCHEATTEQCPIFRKNVDVLYAKEAKRLSWSVPDFSTPRGTEQERLAAAREIRDRIKDEVERFLSRIEVEAGAP